MNENLLACHPLWKFLNYFVMTLLSPRKSERRRCGTHRTEQHLLRSLARQKSLTSLTQHPHRSNMSSLCTRQCLLAVASHCTVAFPNLISPDCLFHTFLSRCFLSPDGEVAERRAAESVRAAGFARKEVQWSWSGIWLRALARRQHMEVSHTKFFLFIHEVLYFPLHYLLLFTSSIFILHIVCYCLFSVEL